MLFSADNMKRIPEIVYFATYVAITDNRIYDSEWFRIEQYIAENGFDCNVRNNALAIVKNIEGKISLETVINNLINSSISNCMEALKLAVKIAYADNYYSRIENEVIIQFREEAHLTQDLLNSYKYLEGTRLEKDTKEFLQALSKRYDDSLINSEKYHEQLLYIERIANEDIAYVRNEIEDITAQLKRFPARLEALLWDMLSAGKIIKKEEKEELKKFFYTLINEERTIIDDTEKNLDILLEHQNASSSRYTVSFMGRTKAGKSTLHSVLLGGINNDFIGRGAERTTRYNYIYDFNGIRIIDTPGIGAPDGTVDEEVAESLADESDLICYLVTTDSIQEDEFNFLEKLKNRRKPVIILLNNKDNFNRTKSKRNAFLSDPLNWYTTKSEKSIQGHIDRINTYVAKNHVYHNYYIIPVHLLAAKEYLTESNPEIKEKFLEGSRINEFLKMLYSLIADIGVVQKSQTIYQAGNYWIDEGSDSIKKQISELEEEERIIKENYDTTRNKVLSAIEKTGIELKETIKNIFNEFKADEARRFTYEHYNDSQNKLNTEFEKCIEKSDVNNKAKIEVTRILEDFQEKIEAYLEELQEDIYLQIELANLPLLKAVRIIDVKFILDMVGAGAGIASLILLAVFPPAGIALLVIAGITGIISIFVKSKDEKVERAKEDLYNLICNMVDEKADELADKTLKEFDAYCNEIIKSLDLYYQTVAKSLKKTYSLLQKISELQNEKNSNLDNGLGVRIINFLTKKDFSEKDRYNLKRNHFLKAVKARREQDKAFHITAKDLQKNDLVKQPDSLQIIMEGQIIISLGD